MLGSTEGLVGEILKMKMLEGLIGGKVRERAEEAIKERMKERAAQA